VRNGDLFKALVQGRTAAIGPQGAFCWDQATTGLAFWLAHSTGIDNPLFRKL
jgi:hypothetical protein